MKLFSTTVGLMLCLSIVFIACDKDEEPDMASLTLEFDFKVGEDDLSLGQEYTINGDKVNFEAVNYYIGGLQLTQANGVVVNLSNQYILAGLGNTATLDGQLEISDFVSAEFFIGVDETTNSQSEMDFTSRPVGDPLGIQDPAMHWNWMTGYKFLRIDGNVDTDGDDVLDTGVAYHLGSAPMLKEFNISKNLSIKGGANSIVFELDLLEVFTGVDLSEEIDTHTGNNLPLAQKIRDNLDGGLTLITR